MIQTGEVPGGDMLVDGDFDQVGSQQSGDRLAGKKQECRADQEPVRFHVGEQAQDQPGVVRLTQHFVEE